MFGGSARSARSAGPGSIDGSQDAELAEAEQEAEQEEEWQDVLPEGGRLVVFLAGAVEHEVLPAYAPRVALTAWFS